MSPNLPFWTLHTLPFAVARPFAALAVVVLCSAPRAPLSAQSPIDSVRRLDSAWARSYAIHDTALAHALFAPDLVVTGNNGTTKNRDR